MLISKGSKSYHRKVKEIWISFSSFNTVYKFWRVTFLGNF
jgi:hypothetical protein